VTPAFLPKRDGLLRRAHRLTRNSRFPIRNVRMRLGHTMAVDLRSGTEWHSFFTGEYDDRLIRAALRLVVPGRAVLDVGANIGFWSVPLGLACKRAGTACFAFEPCPSNASRLRRNVHLNGLDEFVTVHEFALSDRRGEMALSLREDFADGAETGNAALVDAPSTRFATIPVALRRLDEVWAQREEQIGLVKLDVEGHELPVLEGGRQVLQRHRPVILCEWNTGYRATGTRHDPHPINALLQSLHYSCALHDGSRWRQVSAFHSDRGLDDLFLIPAEQMDATVETLNRT
jgi:FkbM family methyltransferase